MPRPTVLLVEDHQLLRWWMTSSLQLDGCSVAAPKSVDDALSLAETSPYDVLITDWRLAEGHNGFEILERVRKKFPETLAILISAEADRELAERARSNGFDLVIEKPFPVAEIVGAVRNLAVSQDSKVAS